MNQNEQICMNDTFVTSAIRFSAPGISAFGVGRPKPLSTTPMRVKIGKYPPNSKDHSPQSITPPKATVKTCRGRVSIAGTVFARTACHTIAGTINQSSHDVGVLWATRL